MEEIKELVNLPLEQPESKPEQVEDVAVASEEEPVAGEEVKQGQEKEEKIPSIDDDLANIIKSEEKPQQTQEEEETYDKKFQSAPELRKELNRLHKLLKQKEEEIKKASEGIKYKEKLEEYEKRLKEYEDLIKTYDYQKSPEFKQKYYEPLEKAWKEALEEISDLTIVDDESGTERKVTAADLQKIISMPTKEAISFIKEKFGEDFTPILLQHRKNILDLTKRAQEAVEEYKKNYEKIAFENSQKVEKLWNNYNNEIVNKYPQFFSRENEEDKDAIDLLDKGYKLADMALNPPQELPLEQKVYLLAELRNRAAAFGKVAYKLIKMEEKVKSLENELKKYKSTNPTISRSATQSKSSFKLPSVEDDLRAIIGSSNKNLT